MGVSCIWYISNDVLPWEVAVLRPIAKEMIRRKHSLSIYGWSPEDWKTLPFTHWGGLSGIERGIRKALHGKLWHVWGKMPPWMSILTFRARLLHTPWRGHGSTSYGVRVFFEGDFPDPQGYRIFPTFDKEWLWGLSDLPIGVSPHASPLSVMVSPERPVYPASIEALDSWISSVRWISPGALPRPGGEELPLTKEIFAYWKECGGVLLFTGSLSLSDVWLGCFASMLAIPVIAPPSPLCEDSFGPQGYIPVQGALSSRESWVRAIDRGISKEGRNAAARCRIRLERLYPLEDSLESLLPIYYRMEKSS